MKNMKLILKFVFIFSIIYIGYSIIIVKPKSVKSIIFEEKAMDNHYEISKENEKKVIYLTFDDGPSYLVTERILDILKENGVKATFFVVGSQIKDREKTLRRIFDEGHSIGLHTYSHKYNKIYSSQENFIEEMRKTSDEINSVIGISPTIIRFPAGSKKRLNDSFLEKLHKENYKVFDWNASISDGINPNLDAEKLYRNAIKIKNKHLVILLMHSNADNKKTCEALPRIIEYYKAEKYEFKIISSETPEFYFRYKILK